MCVGECKDTETKGEGVERRTFITSATAAVFGVALAGDAVAQQTPQPPSNAFDDGDVIQGMVSFKSGTATIQGYQAPPKSAGKYRAVVVMHGDFGVPQINRYTAADQSTNSGALWNR